MFVVRDLRRQILSPGLGLLFDLRSRSQTGGKSFKIIRSFCWTCEKNRYRYRHVKRIGIGNWFMLLSQRTSMRVSGAPQLRELWICSIHIAPWLSAVRLKNLRTVQHTGSHHRTPFKKLDSITYSSLPPCSKLEKSEWRRKSMERVNSHKAKTNWWKTSGARLENSILIIIKFSV